MQLAVGGGGEGPVVSNQVNLQCPAVFGSDKCEHSGRMLYKAGLTEPMPEGVMGRPSVVDTHCWTRQIEYQVQILSRNFLPSSHLSL